MSPTDQQVKLFSNLVLNSLNIIGVRKSAYEFVAVRTPPGEQDIAKSIHAHRGVKEETHCTRPIAMKV